MSASGPPKRVRAPSVVTAPTGRAGQESCTLILVHQAGDKLLLRLNTCRKPIANKYCEGKMKSTLKRELNRPEIVKAEAVEMNCEGAVCEGCYPRLSRGRRIDRMGSRDVTGGGMTFGESS